MWIEKYIQNFKLWSPAIKKFLKTELAQVLWQWKVLHGSFFPSFTDELGKAARQALDGVSAALPSASDSVTATTFPKQQHQEVIRGRSILYEPGSAYGERKSFTSLWVLLCPQAQSEPFISRCNSSAFAVYFYSTSWVHYRLKVQKWEKGINKAKSNSSFSVNKVIKPKKKKSIYIYIFPKYTYYWTNNYWNEWSSWFSSHLKLLRKFEWRP